jgi:LPXTG-site transpeptidase (sortase) family protein
VNVPSGVMLGNDFTFTIDFSNTSGDIGYGPYVDIILPRNGADGAAGTDTPDGVFFNNASQDVTYQGLSLETYDAVFPALDPADPDCYPGGDGRIDHPYALDTLGEPIPVCGTPGDQLVIALLPFGSFTQEQSPATITVEASLSDLADPGTALDIEARGGFRYGENPLDDPCCDPTVIMGTWSSSPVSPVLMTVSKAQDPAEGETATGPNFPHTYTLTVDIAEGQTISNLDVIDTFDGEITYLGGISASPAYDSASGVPAVGATPANGATMSFRYNSITGGAGDDITITYDFFIPRIDNTSGVIVPADTGAANSSVNTIDSTGDWVPIDARDDGDLGTPGIQPITVTGGPCPVCTPSVTVSDQAIAIQKGHILTDNPPTGYSPSDVLTFTIDFQISDYFAFRDIVITDIIGDGHRLTGTPTLTLVEHGSTYTTAAFDSSNYTVWEYFTGGSDGVPAPAPYEDGDTVIEFRVSDELIFRTWSGGSGSAAGTLLGGCVDSGGIGVGSLDCSDSPPTPVPVDDGPTTGTITFQTVIQEEFTDIYLIPGNGDESVDQGDELTNEVDIDGLLVNTIDLTDLSNRVPDNSDVDITIPRGELTKQVYAFFDGTSYTYSPFATPPLVEPGDEVTYRLTFTLPTSDYEELVLTDFLPSPIFDVSDPAQTGSSSWSFDSTWPPAGVPGPGVVAYHPSDTQHLLGAPLPTVTAFPASNSIDIYYGNFDIDPSLESVIDVLLTATVSSEPFADLLYLTNQGTGGESSTNAGNQFNDDIVQIIIEEPLLTIKKGAVSTSNPNGTFTGSVAPPGISWTDPGNPGSPPWSGGPITSNGAGTGYINDDGSGAGIIDADVSDVDGGDQATPPGDGDLVKFAIIIENTGHSSKGAFDIVITDVLPTGYRYPGDDYNNLNLQVYLGDGTDLVASPGISYLGPNGDPRDLFGDGIELNDNINQGICQGYTPAAGTNIVIITYDLEIDPDITPLVEIPNTATLENYAGEDGGTNHVHAGGPGDHPTEGVHTDDSTTAAANFGLTKDVDDTNQGFTSGLQVAIGEVVIYKLTVVVPEGESENVTLVDTLDAGLAFMDIDQSLPTPPDSITPLHGGTPTSLISSSAGTFYDIMDNAVISNANGGTGNRITFDFGTLTNSDNDNTTEETLEIVYRAVVLDVLGNNGLPAPVTVLNNEAIWEWDDDAGGRVSLTDSANEVEVIEPDLDVDKDVVPNTGDYGDPVTYTFIIQHNPTDSQTDAFEVTLEEEFPTEVDSISLDSVVDTDGIVDASYFDLTGRTLTTVTPFDFPYDLARTITLSFSGTLGISVSPGSDIINEAEIFWSSLDGDVSTPQSTHNPDSTERDDYTDTDDATLQINNAVVGKTLVGTDQAHTSDLAVPVEAAIGEIVTYQVAITLPEGTSQPVDFDDLLDQGMAFMANDSPIVTLVSASPGLSTTIPGGFPQVAANAIVSDEGAGDINQDRRLTLDFGIVTNSDTDNGTDEQIVLRYRAIVLNAAVNIDGFDLHNTATWYWGVPPNVQTQTSSTTVQVKEALLEVDKTIAGASVGDAGDAISYEIVISHDLATSSIDALDVTLDDALPVNGSGESYIQGPLTLTVSDTKSLVTSANFSLTGSDATGYTLSTVTAFDVLLDGADPHIITLTIDGAMANTVEPSLVVTNEAINRWTSLPGDETTPIAPNPLSVERTGDTTLPNGETHDYEASDSVDFNITDPAITKAITGTTVVETTSSQHDGIDIDLTIGEEVTFVIEVTLPEGSTIPLTITDHLPTVPPDAGILEAVSSQVLHIGANITGSILSVGSPGTINPGNDTVTFDFGDVVNVADNLGPNDNDRVRVEVVAVLIDDSENQDGDDLANTGEVDNNNPVVPNPTVTTDVDVVVPILDIDKTAAVVTPASGTAILGAVIEYSIEVTNNGTAPAYQAVITDTIPAGMTYIDDVNTTAPAGWTITKPSTTPPTPQVISFTADTAAWTPGTAYTGTMIDVGQTVTFTYRAEIAAPGDVNVVDVTSATAILLDNAVQVDWSSLPEDTANDRTDSNSDVETVTVINPDLRIDKIAPAGGPYVPGSIVTFTLDYYNDGSGTANGVTITDTVPDGTTFNEAASGGAGVWSCANNSPAGTTCTHTIDAGLGAGILHGANDPSPPGTHIYQGTVNFAVTVVDPLPAGIDTIDNTASIAYNEAQDGPEPTPANNEDSDSAPTDAVPILTIVKDDSIDITAPGSTIVYLLTFDNVGTQDATGVFITETVSTGTTFNEAESGGSGVWSCSDGAPAGSVCTHIVDVGHGVPSTGNLYAQTGGIYTVNFAVDVDNPLAAGITHISDTAVIEDDGNNSGGVPVQASDDDHDVVGRLVSKEIIAVSEPAQSPPFTPPIPATLGTILTYRLVLEVPGASAPAPGSVSMNDATVIDVLDQGLAFLGCGDGTAAPAISAPNLSVGNTVCDQGFGPPPGSVGTHPVIDSAPPHISPTDDGRLITFNLGIVTNNTTSAQQVEIIYRAIVLNSSVNTRGVTMNNAATWEWNNGTQVSQLGPESTDDVTVIEPTLSVTKSVSQAQALPGQVITFYVSIEHAGVSDSIAYDVESQDEVPIGTVLFNPATTFILSSTNTATGPATLNILPGNILQVIWDEVRPGEIAAFQFDVEIVSFPPGGIINEASAEWTSLPGDVSTPLSPFNILSVERSYDPLDLVNTYGDVSIVRVELLVETGFAPGEVTVLPPQPEESAYQSYNDFRIEIPRLGIDIPIVGVPFTEKGWEVTWLGKQAGHLAGTAGIGQPGNTFITAHVVNADGLPGPFYNLKDMRWGDTFTIHAWGHEYIYQVLDNQTVSARDFSIFKHDAYDRVTLMTCGEYNEVLQMYPDRIIVEAVLIEVR